MKITPFTLLVSVLPFASQGASVIINPGFEAPVIASNSYSIMSEALVPGWSSTDSQGRIEIWSTGFLGVPSHSENQFAELNAVENAALFQDVTIDTAGLVDFSFAHRGRDGDDTMRVDITYAGANGIFGDGDDVLVVDGSNPSYQYTTGNTDWALYVEEDVFTSVAGGEYRFSYGAVSSAGGISIGNFIDSVRFGVDAGAPPSPTIPEPSGVLSLGALLGFGLLFRRRR